MSRWNPENIRDVAESVGISLLSDEVADSLARDVDFRVATVLENALKFMRHSKRSIVWTQDVSNSLRTLEVEPLYGYESTRPLRFGEASIGPGQPLYYVEDEEVDFEKVINAPLPRVPREISFTAHWLAVEGVQPSIPQNPITDSRNQELLPNGAGANLNRAVMSGNENANVRPLVKHILSKELQLYFDKISAALLDESNEEYRIAALSSLRTDPGLHQLVPYFIQFIAEKVTHSIKNLFVLTQMMHFTESIIKNKSLYIDPYVSAIIPPVLTCLLGRRLGDNPSSSAHYPLREFSAALIGAICKKYAKSSHTLKPRLARTLLKHFLDPNMPLGTHYGAILSLDAIGGAEVTKALILPNIKVYETVLTEAMEDESRKGEADLVISAIMKVLTAIEADYLPMTNGYGDELGDAMKKELEEKIGKLMTLKIAASRQVRLANAILECPFQ